ncbi:MAG: DUF429 domain-containing protein [Rubrivivax sp.]
MDRRERPDTTPAGELLGVDFSSAPSRRKPVTVAYGRLDGTVLQLQRVDALPDLRSFEALLAQPGPWLGAFDFPFGLPRVFVQQLALGERCADVIAELRRRCPSRAALRATIDAFGNARPPGQRLPHRVCDTALPGVTSTSPLQTRYVPVGFMYYEGLSRLVDAGVTLPRLHPGDPRRVALEGYPGLLAHELIGRRSYKNRDDEATRAARADLLAALQAGRTRLGLRLRLSRALRDELLADAAADRLDAVLCLVQAAWASARPGLGLPDTVDPVEGWIATAPGL